MPSARERMVREPPVAMVPRGSVGAMGEAGRQRKAEAREAEGGRCRPSAWGCGSRDIVTP